jgi:hypothetical protein
MPKAGPLACLVLLCAVASDGASSQAVGQEESARARSEAPAPDAADPAQAVVTIGRRATFVTAPVATRSEAPNDSFSIARETQKELHRLGCYEGEINGFWSPQSRSAAQKFVDRINARLPVDKPDDALLALLQSQMGHVCSQCPRGQEFDAAGRCMPTALLKRSPAAIVTGSVSDAPPDPPARPNDERTTHAAPPGEQQPATGERPPPGSRPSKVWQKFIRSVDKALGLN